MTARQLADFVYVDCAFGGVDRRNNIKKISEIAADGAVESFASYARATEDLVAWVATHSNARGRPTVAGFDGETWAPFLPLDIDAEGDLAGALARVRRVLDRLEAMGADLRSVRVYFSGSKGFHLEIPHALFGGFDPSATLHTRLKWAAASILGDIPFDGSIYDKLRLWRLENTRHRKTGRYKVRLTPTEARALDIGAVVDLAACPRPAADAADLAPIPDDDWLPVDALVAVWEDAGRPSQQTAPTVHARPARAPTDAERRRQVVAAIAAAWPHPDPGAASSTHVSRHADYLMPLAGILARRMEAPDAVSIIAESAEVAGDRSFLGGRDWRAEIGRLVTDASKRLRAPAGADDPAATVRGLPTLAARFPALVRVLEALLVDPRDDGRGSGGAPPTPSAELILLADVRPRPVRWLWPGRIPLGKVTVADGDPGLGKSTLTLDAAARVTRGDAMPDGARSDLDGPAGVVLLSAEDGLDDTIRPRLDAAGADPGRVAALIAVNRAKTVSDGKGGVRIEVTPGLPTLADLDAIRDAIGRVGARLVIVDPIMAYLPGGTDASKDQDVRSVLARLSRLAEEEGVAVVVVRHLNKSGGGNALYRGGGSIGIIGAARAGLLVAKDPSDPTGSRRVLAVTKNNLAELPPALAYHMETAENGTARVAWDGPTDHTADRLLSDAADAVEERSARADAVSFLRDRLREGPISVAEILADARAAGIAEKTLRRAKADLSIVAERAGFGIDGHWCWRLPATSEALIGEDEPPIDGQPGPIDGQDGHPRGRGHLWEGVAIYGEAAPPTAWRCSNCRALEAYPADGANWRCAGCGARTDPTGRVRCLDCDGPVEDGQGIRCPACVERASRGEGAGRLVLVGHEDDTDTSEGTP